MKVGGIGKDKAVEQARRRKDAGRGAEFADRLKEAMAATEPGAAVEAHPPAAVDQLVAIQEAPAAVSQEGRKSARQYGHFLLDRLEEIRLALLIGAIPKDQLARLAQTVRQRRERSDDPRLNEVLDEIELRAEVEIAKLTRPVGS